MEYSDYKRIADELAKELDSVLTKECVDKLIFEYGFGLALICLEKDLDIDEVMAGNKYPEISGPFRQRALGLINAEAWCAYLSYVNEVCD